MRRRKAGRARKRILAVMLLLAVAILLPMIGCVLKVTPRVSPQRLNAIEAATNPPACEGPECYCLVESLRYRYKTWSCTGSKINFCDAYGSCLFNSTLGDWCEYVGGGSAGIGNFVCMQWNGCYTPTGYWIKVNCEEDCETDFGIRHCDCCHFGGDPNGLKLLGTKLPRGFSCGGSCGILGSWLGGGPCVHGPYCCDARCDFIRFNYTNNNPKLPPTGLARLPNNALNLVKTVCTNARPWAPTITDSPAEETSWGDGGSAGCFPKCKRGDAANYFCYKKNTNDYSLQKYCKTNYMSTLQGGSLYTVVPCNATTMASITSAPDKKISLFKIGQGPLLEDFQEATNLCRLKDTQTATIRIGNLSFDPESIQLPSYGKLCFANADSETHELCELPCGAQDAKLTLRMSARRCLSGLSSGVHQFRDRQSGVVFEASVTPQEVVFNIGASIQPVEAAGIIGKSAIVNNLNDFDITFSAYWEDAEFQLASWQTVLPAEGQLTAMPPEPGPYIMNESNGGTTATLFVLSSGSDFEISGGDIEPHKVSVLKGTEVCFNNTDSQKHTLVISEKFGDQASYLMDKNVSPGGTCCWTPEPGNWLVEDKAGAKVMIYVSGLSSEYDVVVQNTQYDPTPLQMKNDDRLCFINPTGKDRTITYISGPADESDFARHRTDGSGTLVFNIPADSLDCSCLDVPCFKPDKTIGTHFFRDMDTNATALVSSVQNQSVFVNITALMFIPHSIEMTQPGDVCFLNKRNESVTIKLAEKYEYNPLDPNLTAGKSLKKTSGRSYPIEPMATECIPFMEDETLQTGIGLEIFTATFKNGQTINTREAVIAANNETRGEGVARVYFTKYGAYPESQQVGTRGDIEIWNADDQPKVITNASRLALANETSYACIPAATPVGKTFKICPSVNLPACGGESCGGVIWQSQTEPTLEIYEFIEGTVRFTDAKNNTARITAQSRSYSTELEMFGITPSVGPKQVAEGGLSLVNIWTSGPLAYPTMVTLRGLLHNDTIPVITVGYGGSFFGMPEKVLAKIIPIDFNETYDTGPGNNLTFYNADTANHKIAVLGIGLKDSETGAAVNYAKKKELTPCYDDNPKNDSSAAKECSWSWGQSDSNQFGYPLNVTGTLLVVDIAYGYSDPDYTATPPNWSNLIAKVNNGQIPARLYIINVSNQSNAVVKYKLDRLVETGWGCAGICTLESECLTQDPPPDYCDEVVDLKTQRTSAGQNESDLIVWTGSKMACYNQCMSGVSNWAAPYLGGGTLENALTHGEDKTTTVCFWNRGDDEKRLHVADLNVIHAAPVPEPNWWWTVLPNHEPVTGSESYDVYHKLPNVGMTRAMRVVLLDTSQFNPYLSFNNDGTVTSKDISRYYDLATDIKSNTSFARKIYKGHYNPVAGTWYTPFILIDAGAAGPDCGAAPTLTAWGTPTETYANWEHCLTTGTDQFTLAGGDFGYSVYEPLRLTMWDYAPILYGNMTHIEDVFDPVIDPSTGEPTVTGKWLCNYTVNTTTEYSGGGQTYTDCVDSVNASCRTTAEDYVITQCGDPSSTYGYLCGNKAYCTAVDNGNYGCDCSSNWDLVDQACLDDPGCPTVCDALGLNCVPNQDCIDDCNARMTDYSGFLNCNKTHYNESYGPCMESELETCHEFQDAISVTYLENIECYGSVDKTDFDGLNVPSGYYLTDEGKMNVYVNNTRNGNITYEKLLPNGDGTFQPGNNVYQYRMTKKRLVGASNDSEIKVDDPMLFKREFNYGYQDTKGSNRFITLYYGLPVNLDYPTSDMVLKKDNAYFSWSSSYNVQINQSYSDENINLLQPEDASCFSAQMRNDIEPSITYDLRGYRIYDEGQLDSFLFAPLAWSLWNFWGATDEFFYNPGDLGGVAEMDRWQSKFNALFWWTKTKYDYPYTYIFRGKAPELGPDANYPQRTRFLEIANVETDMKGPAIETTPGGRVCLIQPATDSAGFPSRMIFEIPYNLEKSFENKEASWAVGQVTVLDSTDKLSDPREINLKYGWVVSPGGSGAGLDAYKKLFKRDPSTCKPGDLCAVNNACMNTGCNFFVYADAEQGTRAICFENVSEGTHQIRDMVSGKVLTISSQVSELTIPLIYEVFEPTAMHVVKNSEVWVKNADKRDRNVTLSYCNLAGKRWVCSGSEPVATPLNPGEQARVPINWGTPSGGFRISDDFTGDEVYGKIMTGACTGSELALLAKKFSLYDEPDEYWSSARVDKVLGDYNPHGPAVPAIISAPISFSNNDASCVLNSLWTIKNNCPKCPTLMPVMGGFTVEEQKAYMDTMLDGLNGRAITDFIGVPVMFGFGENCDMDKVLNDSMEVAKYALQKKTDECLAQAADTIEAREACRQQYAKDARLSLMLFMALNSKDLSSCWNESDTQEKINADIAMAYKRFFDRVPELAASGFMGVVQYCYRDDQCIPLGYAPSDREGLGLIDSRGMVKSPQSEEWWQGCAAYSFAGTGLSMITGATENATYNPCDPSRLWALYQQYKCGAT